MAKDIFISYRRSGAKTEAFLLYQKLTEAGYDVFLDVPCMHSGEFDEEIQKTISECTDFILLVSPSCFKRCDDPEDCFLREIECALREGKHITQILVNQKNYPKKLPESLKKLGKIHAHDFPNIRYLPDLIRILQEPGNLHSQPRHTPTVTVDLSEKEQTDTPGENIAEQCRSCKSEDLSISDPLTFWTCALKGYINAAAINMTILTTLMILTILIKYLTDWIPVFGTWLSGILLSWLSEYCTDETTLLNILTTVIIAALFGSLIPMVMGSRMIQHLEIFELREAEKGCHWLTVKCRKCGSKYKEKVNLYFLPETDNADVNIAIVAVLVVNVLIAAASWGILSTLLEKENYLLLPFLSILSAWILSQRIIRNKINTHLEQIPKFEFWREFLLDMADTFSFLINRGQESDTGENNEDNEENE